MEITVLSENLKKFRTQKNLTQEQAAEQLSVNPQTVSRWECGTTLPDVLTLPELARLYGVTVDDFYHKNTAAYDNYAQRLASVYEHTHAPEDFMRCRDEYLRLMKTSELSTADKWNYAIIHHFMVRDCIDTALKWYDKTLADDPTADPHSYYRAYSCRTEMMAEIGRADEAIAGLRRKLTETPDDVRLHAVLIDAYLYAKRNEDALACFNEAAAKFEDWQLYIRGGEIYENLGRYDEAFEMWKKAGEIGCDFHDELYCMAVCYGHMGEHERSAEIYETIASLLKDEGYDVEAEMALTSAANARAKLR